MSFVISPNFPAVCAVAAASFVVHHVYMPIHIFKARKKYGVGFPKLYATKDDCKSEKEATEYNCIQRGHQNSLETQPVVLAMLLAAGLKHPVVASAAGCVYLLGRVVYFHGYATGSPSNRLGGAPFMMLAMGTLLATNLKIFGTWAASMF